MGETIHERRVSAALSAIESLDFESPGIDFSAFDVGRRMRDQGFEGSNPALLVHDVLNGYVTNGTLDRLPHGSGWESCLDDRYRLKR